jgi:hypothetical protein
MSRADELRAELALAEVEEAFSAAKASRNTPAVQKARAKVRAARAELAALLADDGEYAALKADIRATREASRKAREG